ncbi:MAG: hypothetical protein AAF383_27050 [Cyanobacteria bacterium P01_A01_bin.83]
MENNILTNSNESQERSPKYRLNSTLLIQKALKDPVSLNRLCDRVYLRSCI